MQDIQNIQNTLLSFFSNHTFLFMAFLNIVTSKYANITQR